MTQQPRVTNSERDVGMTQQPSHEQPEGCWDDTATKSRTARGMLG